MERGFLGLLEDRHHMESRLGERLEDGFRRESAFQTFLEVGFGMERESQGALGVGLGEWGWWRVDGGRRGRWGERRGEGRWRGSVRTCLDPLLEVRNGLSLVGGGASSDECPRLLGQLLE